MTKATLSAALVNQDFPEGTVDPGFTFVVTGTLADSTPFSQVVTGSADSMVFDLAPGTYTGTVSKLGVSSLPSAALTVTAPVVVTLSVPDGSAAANFAL